MSKNLTPNQIWIAVIAVVLALLFLFTSDIPRRVAQKEAEQLSARLEASKAQASSQRYVNPLTVQRPFPKLENEEKNTQRIIIVATIAIITTVVLCSLGVPKKMWSAFQEAEQDKTDKKMWSAFQEAEQDKTDKK